MYSFRDIGFSSLRLIGSFQLFLRFLGHYAWVWLKVLKGELNVGWRRFAQTIYLSGVRLVVPIMIISVLIGFTLSMSLYEVLSRFYMGRNALIITQNIVINNIIPLFIGIILSIQSALNLINVPSRHLHMKTQNALLEYIIPIIPAVILTALILYIYVFSAILGSVYATFHYILGINTRDYLLHITNNMAVNEIVFSLLKTIIYSSIVSIVIGYYYYEVAVRKITSRKAVSSIMTRSLLWIIIVGAQLTFFNV